MDPVGLLYRDLKNIRPVGSEIEVFDWLQIPGSVGPGEYPYRSIEMPLDIPLPYPAGTAIEVRETNSSGVELPGPVVFGIVEYPTAPTPGSFQIKFGTNDDDDTFVFGVIKFSQYDAGRYVKIIYTGRGSLVWAYDVTDVCKGLSLLPNVIRPGHISDITTDDFYFPRDVNVEGSVNIVGDLNVQGVVNKSLDEELDTSDETILLNSDFIGTPTANMGIAFHRGGAGDPAFKWMEGDTSFTFLSTTSGDLLKIFNDGSVTLGGIMRLKGFTTAQEAALVTVGNIGGVFQNTDDLQVKMVASDGSGGAKLVLLG